MRTGEDLQDEIAFACKMGPKSWTQHGWNLRRKSYMSKQTRLRPLQKPASHGSIVWPSTGGVCALMDDPGLRNRAGWEDRSGTFPGPF